MKYCKFIFFAFLINSEVFAEGVNDVKVTSLYVQSKVDSQANAVSFNKALDASCSNRLYVDFDDKELLSTLLAYQLSDKPFNIMYSKNAPSKFISGHLVATCRLSSIYN